MSTLAQLVNAPGAVSAANSDFAKSFHATSERFVGNRPTSYNASAADELAAESANRGLFSSWYNGRKIAAEDYLRAEQSAVNAFNRESSFNAAEAEKQRSFEERMTRNAYSYAIEDLKRNGINPVLAYGGSPAAAPAGSSARSSSGHSSETEEAR